jgi:hypothetical protein
MPSSNRGMFGRGNGTITVIEQPVMRSYLRKAKIVFYVVLVITATLTATVAASKWQPLLALFAGLVLGTAIAAITAGIVAAWPVIRAIWWWTPETALEHPGFGGDSILPRCSGLGGCCLPRYRRMAEPRSDHFPLVFYRTSVQLRCPAAPPGGGLCPPGPRRGTWASPRRAPAFAPRVPRAGQG